MKIFNKGQVVIPAELRRQLDIMPGDLLDVELSDDHKSIILRKSSGSTAAKLAGSLSRYAKGKRHPSKKEMLSTLSSGMTGKKNAH